MIIDLNWRHLKWNVVDQHIRAKDHDSSSDPLSLEADEKFSHFWPEFILCGQLTLLQFRRAQFQLQRLLFLWGSRCRGG